MTTRPPPTHCRSCGCELIGGSTLKPDKKYASGVNPDCVECGRERRRARRAAREAKLTDAEWEEQQTRKRESQRRYKAKNKAKLAAQRRRSKLKSKAVSLLNLQAALQFALEVRGEDTDVGLGDKIRSREKEAWTDVGHDLYAQRWPRETLAIYKQHPHLEMYKIAGDRASISGLSKFGRIESQLEKVEAELSQIPEDVMAEASRPQAKRKSPTPALPPSAERWAGRQPLPTPTTPDLPEPDPDRERRIEAAGDKAVADARERGVFQNKQLDAIRAAATSKAYAETEFDRENDHTSGSNDFGASGRRMQRGQDDAEAKRLAKNKRQRERRAAKKAEAEKAERRRKQKRDSARRRRAAGRKT